MKKFITLMGLFASFGTQASLPVIDFGAISGIIQQIKHMKHQYEMMTDQYKTAKSQLTSLKSLEKYNVGSYKWGDLLDGVKDFKSREWSPGTWHDALLSVAGENAARYQKLTQEFEKAHPVLSNKDYSKGASEEKARSYGETKAVNRAIAVNSTYAFDDINKHLETVHEITKNIESTENTKSALDLNSRLLSEIAYIQTQNLKMQALLNQGTVQSQNERLQLESQGSNFNRLPDL